METKKFGNRIYVRVDVNDVQPDDVVFFQDQGLHTRFCVSVAKKVILVDQPKGFKPKTKRVPRKNIKEVWRWWKKNTPSASGPKST